MSMRRRKLLLVVGAVALLGVAGFFLFLWLMTPAPSPGVTWDNFHRLRVGMSTRDVEALLGEPNQDTESRRFEPAWHGEKVDIFLGCSGDRLVGGRAHTPGDPSGNVEWVSAEPFMDRIRRWLDESPAIALYHEERPYLTFAIAAGVLILLLWLYFKRRRASSSSPK